MPRLRNLPSILSLALLTVCSTSAHAAGINLPSVLSLVLLTTHAPPAHAIGINLSWDDCGTFGAFNRDFACDVNTGSETLVGSVVPPEGITQLAGIEVLAYLTSTPVALPSWWQFQTAGSCRQFAASSSVDFTMGPFNCADYWSDQGVSIFVYESGYGDPGRARLRLVAAVPTTSAGPLDPNREYYMFKFRVSHTKTVGIGACSGCDQEMLITFEQIKLDQPVGFGDFIVSNPETRSFVTWQARVVPTQNRTWGALKSLYR